MSFTFMNRQITIGRKQLLFLLGFLVALVTLDSAGIKDEKAIVLLALIYLVLRFATKPLSRVIARLGYSIRWKFESGIVAIAVLFLVISLIQIQAMDFMHSELHDIQAMEPREGFHAVFDLEDTQHGFFFSLLPFLGVLGVVGSAVLGGAMAWSVIDPVRRMEQGMRRIASGDFSQPLEVENQDEMAELANRINDTARDLARLQEVTLAEERARALQERITQVITAQEDERRRISRELHDGLGPSLAAMGNRLRLCHRLVSSDPDQAERELEEVTKSVKSHVQEIRELIYDMRPLALDQLGLVGAIRQYVERFSQDTGIQSSFNISGDIALDPLTDVTVFRVVQECLTNVQKHAEASQVEVILQVMDGGLEIMVRDNGRGFDPQNTTPGTVEGGVGLTSMRERAGLVGGSLSVQSSPHGGCKITLLVPPREVNVGTNTTPPC